MPNVGSFFVEDEKNSFLNEHREFVEVIPSVGNRTVGHLQNIDEQDDEIWFLQCPKGTDITQLLEQKMKLPGRTNIGEMEAVAVESFQPEEYSFGFCTKKCRYNLRVLPVKGTIVMRKALKFVDKVSADDIKERCPKSVRVPFPSQIKERHPFFGIDYQKNLKVEKRILKKLKAADRNSLEVSAEERQNLGRRKNISTTEQTVNSINSSVTTSAKRKSKRRSTNDESFSGNDITIKKVKQEKSICSDDEILPDLQWLQNL